MSRQRSKPVRAARGNTLQQVEKFKYLGVEFTSDARLGTRRLMHGLEQQTQYYVSFIALWSQNGSVQTPQSWQFSNRSFFRS